MVPYDGGHGQRESDEGLVMVPCDGDMGKGDQLRVL